MRGFGLLQHGGSVLTLMLFTFLYALPLTPGVWLVMRVLETGPIWGTGAWAEALSIAVAVISAYFLWGLGLLVLSGGLQRLTHPRVPHGGRKEVPLASLTTIQWAFCGILHRITMPYLKLLVPSGFANLYFQLAGMKLGRGVQITSEIINDAYLHRLGDRVVIGGGATLNGHTVEHGRLILSGVTVEDGALVGGTSLVQPGVTVGANAVIANRAVVPKFKSIPSNEVWAGLPARFLKRRGGSEPSFHALEES